MLGVDLEVGFTALIWSRCAEELHCLLISLSALIQARLVDIHCSGMLRWGGTNGNAVLCILWDVTSLTYTNACKVCTLTVPGKLLTNSILNQESLDVNPFASTHDHGMSRMISRTQVFRLLGKTC